MAKSVVGPWARDKLDRLGKYLTAYTTIMKDQDWCQGYHYIDAFAGPGEHSVRHDESGSKHAAQQVLLDVSSYGSRDKEQKEFLAGSPRVALNIPHPFTNYVFVEYSPDRIADLKMLESEYGKSRSIIIRRENCTKYLKERVVANPKINWKKNRAVVFLDPFGMQVNWETIDSLAGTNAIEIFLNFPVGMAIQRLLKRQPENFSDAEISRLDTYFGSPDWKTALYKPRRTLFGEDAEEKINKSGETLLKWYRDRLKTIFPHVSKAALIRNTRGAHLYYLLLASHNKIGVKIANDILSAGETI
ncbi:MAG: three-Cys-motif partner protein TcmP [Planctomycetaceae bacterium]|nr:three-Cys-motif partner protein TcmP [Planctomycetaceae bacterium]